MLRLPRASRLLLGLVVCVGVSAASGAARANPNLERAKQELDELRYDDAARSLELAVKAGGSGPSELADIYRLTATVAAAKGDAAGAQKAFEKMLAIDPAQLLPEGVSPKLAEPFEAARKLTDERGALQVRYELRSAGGIVHVIVENDPLNMVRGALAIYVEEGLEQNVVRRGRAPYPLPVPRDDKLLARIAAIDEYGNRLREFGTQDEPLKLDTQGSGKRGGGPSDSGGGGGGSIGTRWWLWGSVAVVAAGAGTYFGLDVLDARRDLEELNEQSMTMNIPYSEALAVEKRGKRSAILSNVSFGLAGASLAVSAWLLFRTPPSEKKDTGTKVGAAGGDGWMGLGLMGSF